jgi:hypothetical protein
MLWKSRLLPVTLDAIAIRMREAVRGEYLKSKDLQTEDKRQKRLWIWEVLL